MDSYNRVRFLEATSRSRPRTRLAHCSRPDEGLLTEPTTAAQPSSPEPLKMPHTCRSQCSSGSAQLGDGVDAPRRHLCAKVTVSNCHLEEMSMEQATTIGLDIAKHVFQLHGADAAGHVLFRKRITRVKLLGFLAAQTRV